MNENERYMHLEGKIWALEWLLGTALKESGIDAQSLEEAIEQARKGYPATRDPNGPVGMGFNMTVDHVRERVK